MSNKQIMTICRVFSLLVACLALNMAMPLTAQAHHGWSSYDLTRPIYVEGEVTEVIWSNPHVEVLLKTAPDLAVPAGFAQTGLPEMLEQVGGRDSVQNVRVPSEQGKTWRIEFAPIARMGGYNMSRRPETGTRMAFVGYISRTLCDEMRVELVIYADGDMYPMRNTALPRQEPGIANPCNPDRPAATGSTTTSTDLSAIAGPLGALAALLVAAFAR
jgi:hypothetical protein